MEIAQPFVDFLTAHAAVVVFVTTLAEAAGIPLPSRIVLLLAATIVVGGKALLLVAVAAAVGSLIGDHVLYTLGLLTGPRLLGIYCWITLGSEQCVEKTVASFTRFGAPAILFSRFSTGVRLFSSVLSGCGHITYARFLGYDVVGTLVYVALWTTVGHVAGERALEIMGRHEGLRGLVLVVPAAFLTLIAYRLWRRARYGGPDLSRTAMRTATVAACDAQTPRRTTLSIR